MSSPRFTAATLEFLRALARNNDREWFRERKAEEKLAASAKKSGAEE